MHVTAEATLATTSVHLPQKEEGSLDTTATGAAKTRMGNKNTGVRRSANKHTCPMGRASGSNGTRGWAPTRKKAVWRCWLVVDHRGQCDLTKKKQTQTNNGMSRKLTSQGAQMGSARTGVFHGRLATPRGKPAAAAPAARGAGQEGRPGGSSLNPQLPSPEKRSHSV